MPTPFETIKTRLREAVEDVLRGETRAARPARVTVVRTERSAKKGAAAPPLTRVYRLLDELKTLVGDVDRLVAEAKTLLPAKKRPASRKGKGAAAKRRRPRSSKKKTARAKRAKRAAPTVRTQRTTIVTSLEPRPSGTA